MALGKGSHARLVPNLGVRFERHLQAGNAPNLFTHLGIPLKSQQMRSPSERTIWQQAIHTKLFFRTLRACRVTCSAMSRLRPNAPCELRVLVRRFSFSFVASLIEPTAKQDPDLLSRAHWRSPGAKPAGVASNPNGCPRLRVHRTANIRERKVVGTHGARPSHSSVFRYASRSSTWSGPKGKGGILGWPVEIPWASALARTSMG